MIEMYENTVTIKTTFSPLAKGIEGLEKIQTILKPEKEPAAEIGDYKVLSAEITRQTLLWIWKQRKEGNQSSNSNVLYYDLNDDLWVCVRPSVRNRKVRFITVSKALL